MRAFLRGVAERPVLCCLVLAPICLGLQAFVGLRTPVYQGDSSPIFLMEAQRMLAGEAIYRDFFELTLPGTPLAYLALFKVFGVRAWIPDLAWVLLGTGLAWVGVLIAKHLVDGLLALLPSALFLAFAFATEPDPTHHWWSALAAMGALALVMEKRTRWRITGAGFLCGLSALFTQSHGSAAVLGIALFLLWEGRVKKQPWREPLGREVCLLASSFAAAFPVVAYYAAKAGIRRLVFCTVIFPLKYFPKWYWNTPQVYLAEVPLNSGWLQVPAVGIWLFMHLLVPMVYLVLLVRCWRQTPTRQEEPPPGAGTDRLMLLSVVGLSLFAGIASSVSWLRLCATSLPAMVLLVWLVRSPGRVRTLIRGLLWIAALAALVFQGITAQIDWHGFLRLPVGRMAFDDPARYAKFQWLANHTRAGDWVFEADDCDVYFPLDLRDPAAVPFVTATAYTRRDQIRGVLDALERHRVPWVLWSLWLDVPKPRARGTQDPNFDAGRLEPIRAYLRHHYHPVQAFADDAFEQVWERNSSAGEASPRR